MPLPFFNSRRGEGIELDTNSVLRFGWLRENTKAFAQKTANGKIGRPFEPRFAHANAADSRQREGAQLLPIQVECKQVPQILDATQVVWLKVTLFVAAALRLLVFETRLELFEHSLAQLFEQSNVGHRSSGVAKRNGGIEVGPGHRNRVAQTVSNFAEGGGQRSLERSPLILSQSLLADI